MYLSNYYLLFGLYQRVDDPEKKDQMMYKWDILFTTKATVHYTFSIEVSSFLKVDDHPPWVWQNGKASWRSSIVALPRPIV